MSGKQAGVVFAGQAAAGIAPVKLYRLASKAKAREPAVTTIVTIVTR